MTLLRRPSGFLPLAISALTLALIVGHVATNGAARQADEGAAAHVFQLLMPIQALVIVFFACAWLPKRPRAALMVLALQCAGAGSVLATVYLLRL